uniref:GTP-binding protein Rheb n=1 Tax=Serinus canaria TaxID=9135 RepID=A0A8C9MV83_SERCA
NLWDKVQAKLLVTGFCLLLAHGLTQGVNDSGFRFLCPWKPWFSGIQLPALPRGGKSSLTIQFVEGQFVDSYDPTIENTFTKLITVNGQEYHLQLVDTAGQDEYSIFPQTYSIDINGYILVYSVTSIKSFEVIKVIHGKLLDMVGKVQIPIMLVGNKKDLHMERVISYEEGKALAESWNAAFLESSAKENQTAVDVFKRIILEAEKIDGAASQGKSSCSVIEGVRSLEPMDCLTIAREVVCE